MAFLMQVLMNITSSQFMIYSVNSRVHVHFMTNNFLYTNLFSKPFNRDNIDVIRCGCSWMCIMYIYIIIIIIYTIATKYLYAYYKLSKKGKKDPHLFSKISFCHFLPICFGISHNILEPQYTHSI